MGIEERRLRFMVYSVEPVFPRYLPIFLLARVIRVGYNAMVLPSKCEAFYDRGSP